MHRATLLPLALMLGLAGCSGVRKNLRKADGYLEDGRWSAAIRTYQKVLEKKPGEPRALMGVAEAWIQSGEPEKALVPAQVAAEVKAPGATVALGRALLANGRGKDAVAPLEAARADGDTDPTLALLLAEARLAAEDIPGAVSAAEEALPAGGGPAASSLAAWAHMRAGSCDRAKRLAARAITAALDEPSVQAEAAAVFRGCADAEQAGAAANTARALVDEDAQVWFDAAARYSNGGDTEGALRRMSWLRATFPTDGRFAKDLGGLWLALGDAGRAEANLTAALKLPPYADGAEVQGIRFADRRADALTPEQRREEAARLWGILAKARGKLGDKAGVAEALEMAAREGRSTNPNEWLEAARAWMDAGKPGSGIEAAQQAVALRPDHPLTQLTAAEAYAKAGDTARAIGHGRVAWNLEPTNLDTSLMLADLYLSRGENREARRIVEVALSHHPGEPRLKAALKRAQGY
jgi:tetratricopeptide (TPR) repeat protein